MDTGSVRTVGLMSRHAVMENNVIQLTNNYISSYTTRRTRSRQRSVYIGAAVVICVGLLGLYLVFKDYSYTT